MVPSLLRQAAIRQRFGTIQTYCYCSILFYEKQQDGGELLLFRD